MTSKKNDLEIKVEEEVKISKKESKKESKKDNQSEFIEQKGLTYRKKKVVSETRINDDVILKLVTGETVKISVNSDEYKLIYKKENSLL